eukprot:1778704-Rhodomonas_salina.9
MLEPLVPPYASLVPGSGTMSCPVLTHCMLLRAARYSRTVRRYELCCVSIRQLAAPYAASVQ